MTRWRRIIDIETLDVWPSLAACAQSLNVTPPRICAAIALKERTAGRRLEYLDYWLEAYTPKEKEYHTRQNNIFFF